MNKAKTEIENLKTEVAGLKVRIRRIEAFLFSLPEAKDFILENGKLNQDELFEEAKKLVSKHNNASASFIQKELVIGYARTARILDELEEAGIVGPGEGGKPRKVLSFKESKKKAK